MVPWTGQDALASCRNYVEFDEQEKLEYHAEALERIEELDSE